MYHHIQDAPPGSNALRRDLSVSPQNFEAQLRYLQQEGYQTVSLYDLVLHLTVGKPLPERPIILTFDDGYADAYTQAFPLLQHYGFTGTFFLTSAPIDANNPAFLSWDNVREMHEAGMAMEVHSYDHSDLRSRGYQFLVYQTLGPKEAIEERNRRLGEIESVRTDFKRSRFDRAGSIFGDGNLVALMIANFLNGMLDRLEGAFTRQRAFVADASHDLRTPLTIVRGQLEVLSRQPDPSAEDVSRVNAIVATATARMERLVDDMLLLAQAESEEGLTFEMCDLRPLLEAEIEGFTETSDRHFDVGEVTGDEVLVDRERLARVVSNLIANAVAHTESGGTIAVSAVNTGGRVEIAVDDDGPGVPEALRDRVFDRFARLDESRSSAQGGSGLGLAIVKAIAEAHGGSVACLTSPLGGARFVVSLPIRH